MIGWLMIAVGAALVAWTIYSMFVRRSTGWMWGIVWLVGAAALIHYGYQQEYPPIPNLFTGGKSRWY